jgi:hypothetical protein
MEVVTGTLAHVAALSLFGKLALVVITLIAVQIMKGILFYNPKVSAPEYVSVNKRVCVCKCHTCLQSNYSSVKVFV